MSADVDFMLRSLSSQSRKLDAMYSGIAHRLGLSKSAFWILYTLTFANREYTQQDICGELFLSKQTVNSAVQNLCQMNLVALGNAASSLRKKNVYMTERGKRFAKKYIHPLQKSAKAAFLKMNPLEQEIYTELHQKHTDCLLTELERHCQKETRG